MPDDLSIGTEQAQLLRRIAAREESALAAFYDQTASSFDSFAVRMLDDPHEAEEVIQDVFVQIIAAALNEPLGTVKAGIRRGMLKLRDGQEACV